ncbi:MAG TPA: HD domain-containing phosphohydrolase, partial [Anaerolineales bacterium]|nr:HD domain-containing phosphohydrolase [Anaerolineales bacterium]
CRYFDLTPEQAIAASFLPLVAEEDRRAIEEKVARLRSGIVNSETEIHRVIKPDGTVGWQEWTDQSIRDEAGNIIEFQSVGRDITTRKQAEDNLRKSEERFSKAFRASPIMITISQLSKATLLEVNDTFEKITGYKREEVIGRTTFELGLWVNPADRDRLLHILFANGQLRNEEVQFRIRNGNVIIGLLSAELIELGGEKCLIATIEDITERRRAEANLVEAYETTLEGWAKALELRDKETEGHSRRVTESTLVMARAMNIDEEDLIHIRHGAILHDIGKMAIPDEILRKPGPLTDSERQIVMQHPQAAYDLLVRIPHLKKALDIPYCHHEKWDGTGYPRELKGEEIPLAARIFAVVDVWDALSNERVYREAWSKEKVAQHLSDQSGKHFDPQVVTIFLQLLKQGKI